MLQTTMKLKNLQKYISLYLALIVKKPLHPYGNDPKEDEVYMKNNSYYCKGRCKIIKDRNLSVDMHLQKSCHLHLCFKKIA